MVAVEIELDKIKDGDIIYFDLGNGLNNDLIGIDSAITGTDVLMIVDDSSLFYEGSFLVNGGHEVFFDEKQRIYKIGHYSELLKNFKV